MMVRKATLLMLAFMVITISATGSSSIAESNNLTFNSMRQYNHCSILVSSDAVDNNTPGVVTDMSSLFGTSNIGQWMEIFYNHMNGLSPEGVYSFWLKVRAKVIAPIVQFAVMACIIMSLMLLMELSYMTVVSIGVKVLGWKPEKRYKWEAIGEDEEIGNLAYPMVLVQIPMYNELEVYKLSIGAACALTWPRDRIIIQVLDDSTDQYIKDLVQLECKAWANKGINLIYEDRDYRKGFKAGALKKGLECTYTQQCEFVAIFDADFQPESDFLLRTIPFLKHNPKLALVQTRWDFVNYNQCLVTRVQKISLDFHFKVEQESGSSALDFLSFNGTAGVWRKSVITEVGGWRDRTTVEDMDLSVRAVVKGWKFLYVGDIKVKSELPCTFEAYCKQQHRWTSGSSNLFRQMAWEIITAKDLSLLLKFHLIYSFFFVRRIVAPVVAFTFYCVLMPVSAIVPEVSIPVLGAFYIPMTLLLLTIIQNPRSLHIFPLWILFENVMSLLRIKSAMEGLIGAETLNQWVVTKKLGESLLEKNAELTSWFKSGSKSFWDRVNFSQLGVAFFLLCCASYNVIFGTNGNFVYIYLQAFTFTTLGLGFFGSCTSSC